MSQVSAAYRAETEAGLLAQARAGAAKWFGVNPGCVDVVIVGNVRGQRTKGTHSMNPAPYFSDDTVTLYHGDATATLAEMEAGSVDCIVTSPPYFGLRDYGVDGQMGAENTPAEYVAGMVTLFREARRVLADDGTLWLNLGDSYGPGKNLLGIPWRVAFALQDDGWILRNEIIWAKPNGMPESVTDRLASKHEHLFLFAKHTRYWFDLEPIREPHAEASIARARRNRFAVDRSQEGVGSPQTADPAQAIHPGGKNPGDVWTIATQPYPGAHFAVFPSALPERCILAGCKPGGTVLDPFSGSGTTGLAAAKHGRHYIGVDLNAEYLDLSLRTRLAQPGLDLERPVAHAAARFEPL